ncbi:MAG: NirD/YgiW/YdeI family stress tolerance protein, partial [Candidatus Adiutrix sp.]|nr:NirD/YgiW/YdeI family stress tolerance protein [Candidatus Adiutrix sp.]
MKKQILLTGLALSLAFATPALAQGGFTGPGAAGGNVATVSGALKMRDDAWVTLEGKIEKQLRHEKYQFRDHTGVIVLDIDDKRWRGLTVGPEDTVVVTGEVDREFNGREIEVK